ncbi:MAG: efflux RND transporter permease subunit [Parasulfuritortus sp.]|nr:efflux RND transporter permease subunit [Parasulfuritortus sp.]
MSEENRQEPVMNGEAAAKAKNQPARVGIAGGFARSFIQSPLTPLLLIASFVIGLMGMIMTPREEDPQISVPMVDIMVAYPGASAEQVKNLVSEPLERLMSEISGVKHVYSMSRDGQSLVTVRFEVGQQMEPSLVKLYDKLMSHLDAIPKGVSQPLVKPKSIDDVPVVTLTLSSAEQDIVTLRKLALDVQQHIKALPNTGQSFVVGGSPEQVRVDVDVSQLASYNLTLSQLAHAIGAANQRNQAGDIVTGDTAFTVYSGEFLHDARQVGDLLVSVQNRRPVYLRDVARISQGESETRTIVSQSERMANGQFTNEPAVTIAVAKKKGTNGVDVAASVLKEVDSLKGSLIPAGVKVSVTRDYGKTANEKVSHLIFKLILVTVIVTLLMFFTMGKDPAIIVLITIPVVLLMTLAVAYLLGFTINRVSMFALVFAIGILVDDAIVVVENIHRRWLEQKHTDTDLTVEAVDEVGNPTILATFTVVAALLPMAFVSDMMGPFMLPIPVLASAAMAFSLLAAFIFVPWLAARIKPDMKQLEKAAEHEEKQSKQIASVYEKIITPIVNKPTLGKLTLFAIIFAMLASVSLFYFKAVAFKMLPFDNKSELDIVIDMPQGTDLFVTANLANRLTQELNTFPEVSAYQTYIGTSSPFNFNGLVRHYFLRSDPWQGDIAVQLLDKDDRKRSSHEVATAVREQLEPLARAAGARLTIAETPPGPPVLASMVAEIYGPSAETRRHLASDLMQMLSATPDIADINTFMEYSHQEAVFEIDQQRASMYGISVEDINREVAMGMGGYSVGSVKLVHELEQTSIVMQLPLEMRSNLGSLLTLPVRNAEGNTVPLGELGHFVWHPVSLPIFHKDLVPLEYVTADVIGKLGAPLYGMMNVGSKLDDYRDPEGNKVSLNFFKRSADTDASSIKWDGEWQVTYVTFRDMGLAFGAALVLIYMLVVAQFRNFLLPLVVMAPIPLTLIGIIPGHWLLGADFTATSMIGFIALAGIIVRNSILLVDFAKHKVDNGMSVRDAVVLAAEVRMRPIMITALALVIGSTVLLTDPIFQGMAVSLLFGSIVATFLTLVVIPLGCLSAHKSFCAGNDGRGSCSGMEGGTPPTSPAPSPARPPRLEKRSSEDMVSEAPAPAAPSGRPPKLQKKSDVAEAALDTAPPVAVPAPPTPAGRPPRLAKKSEVPVQPVVEALSPQVEVVEEAEPLVQPEAALIEAAPAVEAEVSTPQAILPQQTQAELAAEASAQKVSTGAREKLKTTKEFRKPMPQKRKARGIRIKSDDEIS